MRLHPAINNSERNILQFRGATLSTRIVAEVREALFAKALRPGDFLGTEKDLAQRFNVSRIVARLAEGRDIVQQSLAANGVAIVTRNADESIRREIRVVGRPAGRVGQADAQQKPAARSGADLKDGPARNAARCFPFAADFEVN